MPSGKAALKNHKYALAETQIGSCPTEFADARKKARMGLMGKNGLLLRDYVFGLR